MDPLVSTGWLAERLDDPLVRILDATWFMPGSPLDARAQFGRAHVPGAVFFDIDATSDQASDLPHMLSPPADFAVAARRLGVERRSIVVVYDQLGLFSAPRVWWTFRAMGHAAVTVLDGGLPAWIAEERPIETGWRAVAHGDFKARFEPGLVRDRAAVAAALGHGEAQLVDARPAARFRGEAPEPRPGLRAGHMPGAISLPFQSLVTDGRLAATDALSAAFAAAGIDLAAPIVASCGSGISAAVVALALARLGRWDAPIYDGSWAEWGARADTPVDTGP